MLTHFGKRHILQPIVPSLQQFTEILSSWWTVSNSSGTKCHWGCNTSFNFQFCKWSVVLGILNPDDNDILWQSSSVINPHCREECRRSDGPEITASMILIGMYFGGDGAWSPRVITCFGKTFFDVALTRDRWGWSVNGQAMHRMLCPGGSTTGSGCSGRRRRRLNSPMRLQPSKETQSKFWTRWQNWLIATRVGGASLGEDKTIQRRGVKTMVNVLCLLCFTRLISCWWNLSGLFLEFRADGLLTVRILSASRF